jgi:hypothetical protein
MPNARLPTAFVSVDGSAAASEAGSMAASTPGIV